MRIANFFMRLFFIVAITGLAIALGMMIGLKATDGFKLSPRLGLMYVQAGQEVHHGTG